MSKIKKGDTVKVLVGKDRGRSGTVEKVFPIKGQILVPGINLVKRHIGKRITGGKGTMVEIPKPINLSNIALVCPHCQHPTKVGFKVNGQGKLRICKKCSKEIDV